MFRRLKPLYKFVGGSNTTCQSKENNGQIEDAGIAKLGLTIWPISV